jgi:hypothetical protein
MVLLTGTIKLMSGPSRIIHYTIAKFDVMARQELSNALKSAHLVSDPYRFRQEEMKSRICSNFFESSVARVRPAESAERLTLPV